MTAKKQDVFSKVVVTSDAYGAAQVDLSVLYDEAEHCALSLLNLGSKAACYSHDGVADAGELNPANASIGEVLDGIRRHSVFLRLADGVTGTTTIRVKAWVAK
jgi:hypothetical protein